MIFHYRKTIDSTNTWAKQITDTKHMHTLYAGYQTAGKGRRARKWISSPDTNVLMSITHIHTLTNMEPWFYGIVASYSVILLLKNYGIDAYYKWPNDVWTPKGKICGILPESTWNGSTVEKIIVGIGLNVNEPSFPEDIVATSMYIETRQTFDIHSLVRELSYHYMQALNEKKETIIEFLWEHFIWKDMEITIMPDNVKGIPIRILNDGSLVISNNGKEEVFRWGEITIRKI